MKHALPLLALCLVGAWASSAHAAEIAPGERAFFETKIRPVLVEHCYKCHAEGAEKIGANLYLDSASGMRKGGESGPALGNGDPDASLILQALRYEGGLEMPPDAPLPENILRDFSQWLRMGAPDPRARAAAAKKAANDANHWSFQPVKNPAVPVVKQSNWTRDPIDSFILARLDAEGLVPAGDASPEVLVRRLSYDLLGLPPTVEQVAAFMADHSRRGTVAVETLVDQFLASPQFGERWGRHWLDVARFGESNGNDGLSRNASFPHAWRYRDYVIQSFNADVPYDRFLTEQIAGDLLPANTPDERARLLIATGFLAIGSKPAKAMNENFEMDVVADQIDVVGSGVMALSVACARCHDHKHDPIPTRDYYAMAGIFRSTETLWGAAASEGLTAPPTALHILNPGLAQTKPTKTGIYPKEVPVAMGIRDRDKPDDCQVNIGGESKKLGDRIPRGFLSAAGPKEKPPELASGGSGRLQLARWLTSRTHPLTARVMVNRVWLHLFGQGLARTVDDFGIYGETPSHPELLDHLAARFMEDQWSVKRLIRAIVLSRTYQLSSDAEMPLVQADAANVLLARHDRRRLDAEAIRDSILRVSGQLNLQPGTGSIIEGKDILINEAGNLHQPSTHRSIYLCYLRNSPPPDLAPFNLPDALTVKGQRETATLPTQTLFFLNSSFVVEQSKRFADSLLSGPETGDAERIVTAFRRALHRKPSARELESSLQLLRSMDAALRDRLPRPEPRLQAVWASLCQSLFAATEFRFVD